VDGVEVKLCKNLMGILTETDAIDTELLVYTMTLVNKVQILLCILTQYCPVVDVAFVRTGHLREPMRLVRCWVLRENAASPL